MIQILQFCGGVGAAQGFDRPFNHGAWTFATDGRIVLRVARMPQWMEHAEPPQIARLAFDHELVPASLWLPPSAAVGCSHNADCVRYGRHHVLMRYARLMFDLPEIMIAPEASGLLKPIRFRFDGGLGYVMGVI